MLQLTKRTEYGLIALVHLVDREGEFVSVREICDRYPVPRRLVAEVLKDLLHAGLVDSQRGAAGGYALTRSADRTTLADVVSALEGRPSLTECESLDTYEPGSCGVEPLCPIRSPIHRVRTGIWNLFVETSLRDLARGPANAAISSQAS